MWRGLAVPGLLLLTACGATGPSLRLPETTLPLTSEAPPPPRPPESGPFDSASSRAIRLVVHASGTSVRLFAWCRVGVWTTLDHVRPRTFVVRESWGRLGQRTPRLLARVRDQALDGVIARVKPLDDGRLLFLVEVAETEMRPSLNVDIYEGQRVALGQPLRHGVRFSGSAPAGWIGPIARWDEEIVIYAGDERGTLPPPGALLFAALGESGFVAGRTPAAEAFVEEWIPEAPFHFEADGIERMDYRLVEHRSAAGFATADGGPPQTYGPPFTFTRHHG